MLVGLPIFAVRGGSRTPASLPLTGWWRDYSGSGGWAGTASAGTSGSGSNDLTDTGDGPASGPSLNGHGTASFDSGLGHFLQAEGTEDRYLSPTAFSGWILLQTDDSFTFRHLFGDENEDCYAYVEDGYVALAVNGEVVVRELPEDEWCLVTFRYDGTHVSIGVNEAPGAAGGDSVTALTGSLGTLAYDFSLGTLDGSTTFHGIVAEFALTDVALTDQQFTGVVIPYVEERYDPGAVPAPTAASLNHTIADNLGGDTIVATGTGLSGATCTVGGVTATVSSTTSTTVTFTVPAGLTTGNKNVVFTTSGGSTSPLTLELWNPGLESGTTLFAEAPNYVVVGGTGTWTVRVGSNIVESSTEPPASGGAPDFSSHRFSIGNLNSFWSLGSSGTQAGTFACVIDPDAVGGTVNNTQPFNELSIWGNGGVGAKGASLTTAGFRVFIHNGTYRGIAVPVSTGVRSACLGRWSDNTSVDNQVNGGSFTTDSLTVPSTGHLGVIYLGSAWGGGSPYFDGRMYAVYFSNTKVSDTFADKFYRWSKCRHGVS